AVAAVVPASSGAELLGRLAWEVVGAGLAGAGVGVLAAWGLRVATRHRDLEPGPELVLTVLLAVATLGIARSIGTDGVLAVFVAGLVYSSRVGDDERIAQDDVDEAINRYATIPLFVVLGAVLPWGDWVAFGPAALVFAVLVLVLRRPPVLLALARPLGWSWREAGFLGWFGPMGVSAIFYLAHSADAGVRDPRVFAAGTLAVTAPEASPTWALGPSCTVRRRCNAEFTRRGCAERVQCADSIHEARRDRGGWHHERSQGAGHARGTRGERGAGLQPYVGEQPAARPRLNPRTRPSLRAPAERAQPGPAPTRRPQPGPGSSPDGPGPVARGEPSSRGPGVARWRRAHRTAPTATAGRATDRA
ncbi:cation:proton antiporter, partial [Actinotalea sp. C106]|uniref:cation:proton antiporter domain-containing protein n=1 Tax=Actinotalea sp. C106 TaxID=2908644 RepID=UPI002028D685